MRVSLQMTKMADGIDKVVKRILAVQIIDTANVYQKGETFCLVSDLTRIVVAAGHGTRNQPLPFSNLPVTGLCKYRDM